MWSLVNSTAKINVAGGATGTSGGWMFLQFNKVTICNVELWPFASCGVGSLFNFKSYNQEDAFAKVENVDAMIKFLGTYPDFPGGQYIPHEWYFVLSGNQMEYPHLRHLIKHPCVQQVDAFSNKAHTSSGMNLFRLSEEKDFAKWKALTTR